MKENHIIRKIGFVLAIIAFVFVLYPQGAEAKTLRLNKKSIPSIGILDCLKSNYDKNQDGKLSNRELKKVTCINLTTVKSTKELKCLLKFPYLKKIDINTRNIKTLKPLTKLKRLKTLNIVDESRKIKQINLNQFHNVTDFWISAPLTKLTVSKKKKIEAIELSNTKLKTINATKMKYLKILILSGNKKLQSVRITDNPNLKSIRFDNASNITNVKIQNVKKLRNLVLKGWNYTTGINIDDVSNLTSVTIYNCDKNALDYSKMVSLEEFCIYGEKEKDFFPLEVLKIQNLKKLDVTYEKHIKELNLDGLPNLTSLSWRNGILENIQLTKKNKIKDVNVEKNNLSGDWDMNGYTSLHEFACSDNHISSINMRNSKKIYAISCDNNNLQLLDVYNAPSLSLLAAEGNPNAELYIARKPSGDEWQVFDSTAKVHYNPVYKNYPF